MGSNTCFGSNLMIVIDITMLHGIPLPTSNIIKNMRALLEGYCTSGIVQRAM